MVLLNVTDRIISAFEAVPIGCREELELPATLKLHGPIEHEQLLRLSKHLEQNLEHTASYSSDSRDFTILSGLLRGTKVYVPPPPKKPEPSPEYLASKARLLAIAQEAEYQRLLNPSYTPDPDQADPHSSQNAPLFTEDPLTPSLVLNIFLSVIITGFSVYWALTKFTMPHILATIFAKWTGPRVDDEYRPAGTSDAVRVLLSLFAALSVAVAESFLYVFYIGKIDRARAKEKSFKERKVFVKEVDSGKDTAESDILEADEKEKIWGKGVNGGVRRRVREKWEKENNES